jgi:hypothetical protein
MSNPALKDFINTLMVVTFNFEQNLPFDQWLILEYSHKFAVLLIERHLASL